MKLFSKMISNRAKKGFTLVEMLIVIGVLVVILAVTVPNVAGYVRRIELMELDDSARSIFMAVQNKMTVMKQSGEDLAAIGEAYGANLPEVFKKAEDPPADPAGTPSPTPGPDPAGEPDPTTYVESLPKYLKNTKGTDNELVTLTTIEGQLYNHNYVIEYDATTGRVFGVFYSEEAELKDDMYPTKYMTLDSRTFEKRLEADKLVGYYGGEGQLMKVPTGGEVPSTPNNVGNSTLEKLAFVLEPPQNDDGTYKNGKYYFEVTVTGKDAQTDNEDHTITIVPYDNDNLDNSYFVENGKGVVILDSIAPGCGSDDGKWYLPTHYDENNHNMTNYTLERDFRGWVYILEQYRGDFFSDLNNCNRAPGKQNEYDPYVHGLSEWGSGKNYIFDDSDKGRDAKYFAKYFRIDPGSDITVTIKRYKDGSLFDTKDYPVNSYFDSVDGQCAIIKAGRHLQNLANQPSVSKINSARLEKDIDFSEDKGNYESWNSSVTYKGTSEYPYLYNFKPVNLNYDGAYRANFKFDGMGKDGTQHSIKYIRIDTVNDPRFKSDPSVNENTAFFTNFDNTEAHDILFYCPVVIGAGDNTAVFFAKCERGTNTSNFTVINPIVESSGKFVGGIIGELNAGLCKGHNIYVEEVPDYFNNYAFRYDQRGERTSITWDDPTNDPYERFYIKGTGIDIDTYAGGIAGHTSTQLTSCAAAIRVESTGYAGGLVGLAKGTIDKCHVGGHTYNGSFKLPGGGGYLVNIKGDKGAGGIAAEFGSGGGVNGSYTTCSVGFNETNKNNCDTFVGISTDRSASNGAYAIGWLINPDTNEYKEVGSNWDGLYKSLDELIQAKGKNGTTKALNIYDSTLSSPYPYDTGGSNFVIDDEKRHLGDWPIEQMPAKGYGMFYWEIEDGVYHIKAVGDFNDQPDATASNLCTNLDGKGIGDYGYGYFYSEEITGVDNTVLGGQEVTDNTVKSGITSALNSAGLQGVNFRLLTDSGISDKILTFTGQKDGTAFTKEFHYNPGFCALSTSVLTEYEIRSYAQLKNLSDNSSYWDKNFSLSHDIPFNGHTIAPIGVSGTPFTGKFDGHLYRIVDAKLNPSGSTNVGVFGYINNATINGVVVFNAAYDFDNLPGGASVGGVIGRATGSSKITNCAFTGKIEAETSGDISAGGIVGIADGNTVIRNCQAILNNTEADIFATGSAIAAGGIAGKYSNGSAGVALENCYSGGFITTDGCDNPYVGGIIGNNISADNNVIITNCYTYYQTNIAGAHPIGKEISGGAGHITYSNCYYLGGDWFSQSVTDGGVVQCATVEELINSTASLRNDTSFFGTATERSFAVTLDEKNTYVLPAVISETNDEGTKFYHYGQSPEDTLIAMGDKRFGVFYWENEGGAYNLKVCYYDKPSDTYEYQTESTLCTSKDGHAITDSGYGYFIGKGVKAAGMNGFDGLGGTAISSGDNYTGIVTSVEDFLNHGVTDEANKITLNDDFKFAFYDFSTSNDVNRAEISLNSADPDANGKEFTIIPGLCAISNSSVTREVRTVQHLKNVSRGLSNSYHQTHDIIFTAGDPITPIGDSLSPFKGTYDGGCYRIHNPKVQSNADNIGLFGYTSDSATIKNTFVIDGNVVYTGSNNPTVGGIVGHANNTTIQNCIYTGSIEVHLGNANSAVIGGIAGSCEGGTLTNCEATANINATGVNSGSSATVGGIAGSALNTSVSSCYSGGSVLQNVELSEITVGGIVGNGNNAVNNCYTHMNIPQFKEVTTVNAHPIGNNVAATNCHYIESRNHYANDFEAESSSGITKHYDFDINMNGNGFGSVGNTYPTGLTAVNESPYPMPAVVKDGSTFVHYGVWKPIKLLYAPGYGVFYWEKEGEDVHVRVCGIKEVTDGVYETINNLESEDFCYDMDNKPITSYGYGYFRTEAKPIDTFEFNYTTTFSSKNNELTRGITKALKDLGIDGVEIVWGRGSGNQHKDTTITFTKNNEPLLVGGKEVHVKFNLDFCYLKMWTGAVADEPDDLYKSYKYEIRNAEHLGNVKFPGSYIGAGYNTTTYFESSYIQTHDIFPSWEGWYDFNPIGTKSDPFKGTYNGNGYRLIDVVYNSEDSKVNYIGMFGYTDGATIENVTMFNANISALRIARDDDNDDTGAVGGIVAYAIDTKINNCVFDGVIVAGIRGLTSAPRCRYAVGGIVGYGKGQMEIENCESIIKTAWDDSALSASYHLSVGGIAGISSGYIKHCYSGGILGAEIGGIIFNIGDVCVTDGGIVGTGNVTVTDCYSYMKIADNIERRNPIANTYTHRPLPHINDKFVASINNCYCLTGTNFYDTTFTGTADIKAYSDVSELAKALKASILPDGSNGISRYNATAYATDLNNPGVYPLAAVVKIINNKGIPEQYVHYGYVNGLIQYKVDIKAAPLSYGKAEADKKYALPGDTVTVTATPASSIYKLDSITVNGKQIPGNTFTMPENNVNVVVTFKSRVHGIGFEPMSHGTISVKDTAEEGTKVEFTANPDSGYTCKSVTVKHGDTTITHTLENGVYSFIMPSGDVTISAVFEKAADETIITVDVNGTIYNLTVKINPAGAGTFECKANDQWGNMYLKTTANNGWRFKSIKIVDQWGNSSNDNSKAEQWFSMNNGNVTVIIEFEKDYGNALNLPPLDKRPDDIKSLGAYKVFEPYWPTGVYYFKAAMYPDSKIIKDNNFDYSGHLRSAGIIIDAKDISKIRVAYQDNNVRSYVELVDLTDNNMCKAAVNGKVELGNNEKLYGVLSNSDIFTSKDLYVIYTDNGIEYLLWEIPKSY